MPRHAFRRLAWSVVLLLSIFLVACQEERPPTEQSAPAGQPAPEAAEAPKSTMVPAKNQGAPVPEGQALEVLRFGPEGAVKKLNQVVAMFNQPMVALGDYRRVPEGALVVEPPLEGECLWLNQYTLAFVPQKPLTGSLDLTARLNPAVLTALSGATVAGERTIRISLPDLEAPSVYQTNSSPLDEDQALRPEWRVSFNQPPDPASLAAKARFVYSDPDGGAEQAVPALAEPRKDGLDTVFIFQPKEKLPRNVKYRLTLEAGVISLAGPKPAPELVLAQGATYGPLTISLDGPADRPVDPESGLYLHFSNAVDLAKVLPLISIDQGYDLSALRKFYVRDAQPATPGETPEADQSEATAEDLEDVSGLQDYLFIQGGFKAGTEYTLTVDGAARDVFGQSLGKTFTKKFKTGEYPTYLELGDTYGLLETASDPVLRLAASNIKEAQVAGYALTAEQAIKFLAAAEFTPEYYGDVESAEEALGRLTPKTVTLPVPRGARDGRTVVALDLKKLFGEDIRDRFLYLRSAWTTTDSDNESRQHHSFRMIQVSDLGLAVKVGPASSLIWVTDLAKGTAWPGVDLELRDAEGRQLWSGRSDASGLAELPGTRALVKQLAGQEPNIFVVARAAGRETGDDARSAGPQMALWNVNWNDGLETWRWNVEYGDALGRETAESNWLLNALPLYKPGETAKFKIIARESDGEKLKDLTAKRLRVEIRDGQNDVVDSATLEVGPFGTATHELTIPADASLGHWTVQTGREGEEDFQYLGGFLVMTYRPPAFEIKIDELPKNAVAGDEVQVRAQADYHFGAPVAGQPVRYSVNSSPALDFSLPGDFSVYSVTNPFSPIGEDDASDYYDYSEPSTTVASDETTLDREGRLTFPLKLTPEPDQKPAPRNYGLYFTVTDVDQRQVSANAMFLAHPADLYAGLFSDNFVTEANRPYKLKVIAADREGRLVPGQKITATVYRRVWQNVRRKTAGAAYEYVSRRVDEKVSSRELTSGKLPTELEVTPEKPGYYWVLAEIKDDKGRPNEAACGFYVSGSGPVGWEMDNDDRLTLVPDRKEYEPGQTARILVQSPFEEGQGLLTVERAGVRRSQVFTIDSQTPILEVPLAEEDAPNVFVSVLLSRGRIADKLDEKGMDFGKPAIRLGYTELKVPSKKDLLKVAVTPDLAEVGPGGEVEVALAVTDAQGKPFAEAEVALIAADAAVIQLAGAESYFPERQYHRNQPLLVQTADNLVSLIGRQTLGLKGGSPGGGGGEALAAAFGGPDGVRRRFAALAWFEPRVTLDDQGRAKVKMKMPENLTTFKIYAVATGHGRLTGTGQSSVLVTRDLLARSALPNYAGVGDEFVAAMVVTNRGKKAGEAKVTLAGDNFTALDETQEKSVSLKPGESREVGFKVKAGPSATAKFHFTVAMGGDSDSVEFAIPVSPPNPLTTQASYERITGGEWRTDLALAPGLDLGRGGVKLELSPSLVGVLSEPFDWLLAYPHGCVEQATSRGYGNLLWLRLKDRLPGADDQARQERARKNVQSLLAKLNQWEHGGGYNYWPDNYNWSTRSVYLSAYVLDFLLSAREDGFEAPDPALIGRVTSFLKNALSGDFQNWPSWYSETAIRETKSYALAMLSRAGENVAAYTEVSYNERQKLGLFELVNLVRAINFQSQGQDPRIKTLLPMWDKYLQVSAGQVQLVEPKVATPEIWSSSVRTSAMALTALCETAPRHDLIPGLVRGLVEASRAGHFGTTQNNAVVLTALSRYVRTMEPGRPDLNITALLGSTTLAQAHFKAFTDPPVVGSAPLSAVPAENPAVIYKMEGQGQAWASLRLQTAPTEPDLSAATSGGFMLSRSFTVVSPQAGGPGAEQFKRGDLVRVSVTMMVPAPRHSLVLEDRVPAGLEPVNFNLGDADLSLLGLVNEGGDDENRWSRYWYNHQEIWPDRVAVYADHVNAGVYTFSYLARAVTVGTYLTPGPKAEEMYAPETFGRGEGQKLVVE